MRRETQCLICSGRGADRLGVPCLNCAGTGVVVTSAKVSRSQIQWALSLFGLSHLPSTVADVRRAWTMAIQAHHPDVQHWDKPVGFDAADYAKARAILTDAIVTTEEVQ